MAIRKPTIDRPKTGDLYDLFNAALIGALGLPGFLLLLLSQWVLG